MLRLYVDMRRKSSNYEVKAVITCNKGGHTRKEVEEALQTVRKKLEHVIPTSYRARYVVNSEEVVVRMPGGNAADSMRLTRRVEDILQKFISVFKI